MVWKKCSKSPCIMIYVCFAVAASSHAFTISTVFPRRLSVIRAFGWRSEYKVINQQQTEILNALKYDVISIFAFGFQPSVGVLSKSLISGSAPFMILKDPAMYDKAKYKCSYSSSLADHFVLQLPEIIFRFSVCKQLSWKIYLNKFRLSGKLLKNIVTFLYCSKMLSIFWFLHADIYVICRNVS